MRKISFLTIFFFCAAFSFAAPPSLLSGIWQGSDRLILFGGGESDSEISVVLRVFYGWYSERSAEPSRFKELSAREKNNAQNVSAEDVSVSFKTIFENSSKTAGVYEIVLGYPTAKANGKIAKEYSSVPVAVLNGKIYLDFLLRIPNSDFVAVDSSESRSGFWRAAGNASGITISPPKIAGEVRSFFADKDTIYSLRYWKSEMEYAQDKASFSDGNSVFEVAKFLKIGDEVYQCTTGRGTKIRNIEKSKAFPKGEFDSENTICVLGNAYLTKVPEKSGESDLLDAVKENNSRKHPVPKQKFGPFPIDFHWKEISELEKYNPNTWSRRNMDLGK